MFYLNLSYNYCATAACGTK